MSTDAPVNWNKTNMKSFTLTDLLHLAGAALLFGAAAQAAEADAIAFFESKIRPLLAERCYDCHSGAKTKGGLALDSKSGWEKGGDSGAAIVPGKPEESLLIKAVSYHDKDLAMPPEKKGGKLPDDAIAALTEWVRMGAPDPRVAEAKIAGMNAAEAKTWWAFQPLPAPSAAPASAEQMDAFVDARLASEGVPAAPPADKRTLIRRATFDLTGLPPTPEEVEAFVADAAPDAFAKLVARLLDSPHYGEKWGRHWLDVVRYADSWDGRVFGQETDFRDAWRYRDWVVSAFNRDLPYDQFITQQLAGDILAAREWDAQKVIATGMYAIGAWGNGDADKEKIHTDIVDDQIDVTGRAFLGLTLGCARCHDHKFDPLTTRDYYGLAGIFFSSRILEKYAPKGSAEFLMRIPLLSPEQVAERERMTKRVAAIDAELKAILEPFSEFKRDYSGVAGLASWNGKSAPHPLLFINTNAAPVAFASIRLPARSIAVHPAPTIPANATWRSPLTGAVKLSASLQDADPNGGDGIAWQLRHGGKILHSGEMNNGGTADVPETAVAVREGELLQLVVLPRGDYACDTTQIEFKVRDETGRTWDLRETLVNGAKQGQDNVWWLCSGEGAALPGADSPEKRALTEERKQLAEKLARTEFAEGLREGGITATPYEGYHDARIHKRGRYDQLGDVVPRAFPALLTKEQPSIREGSGRLELARWIASKDNPLTARVMVNRIWQHHFGEGLVRSANNFGKLGTPPTHPALLDLLAAEFIRSGWSVKHMHRLIMGTAAYQRGDALTAEAKQRDPDNRLLSHQHRRRLTSEELRDAMLCAAGRLDRTMGGASVRDFNAPRRTLYITTIRSERRGFPAVFDAADPTTIIEKRNEATIAPQSLFLLNDPFTLAQADALAAAAAQACAEPTARVRWLWRRIFQHDPSSEDAALAARALGANADAARWTSFCQALLCSNEFIYVD